MSAHRSQVLLRCIREQSSDVVQGLGTPREEVVIRSHELEQHEDAPKARSLSDVERNLQGKVQSAPGYRNCTIEALFNL